MASIVVREAFREKGSEPGNRTNVRFANVPGVRLLPRDPTIRAISIQSVLSAFGQGTFLTGSAVFFTQIVGISAAQVGLGLTIAMGARFLVSVPLGKLSDRIGAKRAWAIGSAAEVALFLAWFLIGGFWGYLVMATAVEIVMSLMRSGRNAYALRIFPRETRVRSMGYMRASRNVGYTIGALAGGIALAQDSDAVIRAIPLVSAAVLLLNVLRIVTLPPIPTSEPDPNEPEEGPGAPAATAKQRWGALRNVGFVAMTFCGGVLNTHQVLLNIVIPLWLVEETDAPRVLLAWLFGTNTVMAVALQVAATRGVTDVATSLRAQRRGAACMLLSCLIILITHDTAGAVTIALVWLGHITVTGAELLSSAGEWGLIAELSDPRRAGEYQGVAEVGFTLGYVFTPALFTFLAMEWHTLGWVLIAGIVLAAAAGIHPAARAAERFHARHHGVDTVQATPQQVA